MIAVERRLTQPRWLTYVVPFVSVAVAFGIMAVVLLATGHDPIRTYRRLFDAAFHGSAAWTDTVRAKADKTRARDFFIGFIWMV